MGLVEVDYWAKKDLLTLNIKLKNDSLKKVRDNRKEENLISINTYAFRLEEFRDILYIFKKMDIENTGVQNIEPYLSPLISWSVISDLKT